MKKYLTLKTLGIMLGALILLAGFYDRQSFIDIKSTGLPAMVNPIEQYSTRKATYKADISFTTKSGEKITQSNVYFPEAVLQDFEANKPVVIYYKPENPSEFVFEKDEASWSVVIIGAFFIIAACVPIIGNVRVR